MARTKSAQALNEEEAMRVFNDVMKCDPLLSREDVEYVEQRMRGSGSLAVALRIGLMVSVQNGEWFKKLSEDRSMACFIAGQLDAVEHAAAALRELAGVIDSAALRIRIALCAHSDIEQLMAESKSHAVFEVAPQVTH